MTPRNALLLGVGTLLLVNAFLDISFDYDHNRAIVHIYRRQQSFEALSGLPEGAHLNLSGRSLCAGRVLSSAISASVILNMMFEEPRFQGIPYNVTEPLDPFVRVHWQPGAAIVSGRGACWELELIATPVGVVRHPRMTEASLEDELLIAVDLPDGHDNVVWRQEALDYLTKPKPGRADDCATFRSACRATSFDCVGGPRPVGLPEYPPHCRELRRWQP